MKGSIFLLLTMIVSWGAVPFTTIAQPVRSNPIPVIESAESVFMTAIQAYEDQDYETAARLFGVVANTFEFHRKTTAALLMRGKAFFQNLQFAEVNQVLNELVSTYPTSRYAADAQQLLDLTGTDIGPVVQDASVLRLGIALPLNAESSALTQQLFNGIRLAVEEYNNAGYDTPAGPRRKIKMIFRDTQNQEAGARDAIESLAEEAVDAIIGPLFSNEAIAAAGVAEQARIVMIAPMATDDIVSRDKQYVFQANPSIATRGRLMARMAVLGLGINDLGILTDNNSQSLRMARAFAEEVQALEADLTFQEYIPEPRSWFRLSERVSRDTLLKAEAIYLPINGGNASTLIGGALGSLARMPITSRTRLLGNVEWHNISQVSLAGNYSTTYSNDFFVNPADSIASIFEAEYTVKTGEPPSRLTYSGYDVTRFLAQQFDRQAIDPRPLDQLIHEAPPFQGYGNRLDFRNGNVNEAMFYHRYKDGLLELIR